MLTSGSGGWPLHWDNEEFDLASGKFVNAYPRGAPENYAPAEGPTRVEDMPKQGYSKREFWQDADGFWRIPWFASYGDSSQAYHQYAYDPDSQRLVAYVGNQTFAYDVHARKWSDTGAAAFSRGSAMHWGSMCYDPVNRELLSIGGSSFERGGTPGSWVFKCSENQWEKLACGSDGLRQLNAAAADAVREAEALTIQGHTGAHCSVTGLAGTLKSKETHE